MAFSRFPPIQFRRQSGLRKGFPKSARYGPNVPNWTVGTLGDVIRISIVSRRYAGKLMKFLTLAIMLLRILKSDSSRMGPFSEVATGGYKR